MTNKPAGTGQGKIQKKIRFRVKGKWTEWIEWGDKKRVPKDMEACEIHEILTLAEVKQYYPEEYRKMGIKYETK